MEKQTSAEAARIESDYQILTGAREPDFRYITAESEVRAERERLKESFTAKGDTGPSDDDVKWGILNQKAIKHTHDDDFGLGRNIVSVLCSHPGHVLAALKRWGYPRVPCAGGRYQPGQRTSDARAGSADRRARPAGECAIRQRAGVHLAADAGLGRGTQDYAGSHPAGASHAERPCGELPPGSPATGLRRWGGMAGCATNA
jgi:hypothetical protein